MAKKQITMRIEEDYIALIDNWRTAQKVPPAFAAVVDQAIIEFLRTGGMLK